MTPGGGRAIKTAVEQLTFGNEPAAVRAAVGPSGPGYEIEREPVALGPTRHHRLPWSYLDDLPRWRHLKRPRPDVEGQLSLL